MTPKEALLAIVSERTGYPIEMLDLDLDLEADLSIDSIKRIEILGALAERLGASTDEAAGQLPEGLARVKTLRAILEWVQEEAALFGLDAGSPDDRHAQRELAAANGSAQNGNGVPEGVERYLLALEPTSPAAPNGRIVERKHVVLVDDGRGIAAALSSSIEELGGEVVVVDPSAELQEADILVDLSPFGKEWLAAENVKHLFTRARDALLAGAEVVIVAAPGSGHFGPATNGTSATGGGGVGGLLKSLAKEWPERNVRAVHLAGDDDPEQLASHLLAELLAGDTLREVGYANGLRSVVRPIRAEHEVNGDTATFSLDERSVVLVTGGARGITARVSEVLARRFQCRLELVGRSPLPEGEEDEWLAGADDLPSLRRVLVSRGELKEPAAIEAAAARILADREIRRSITAIEVAGSEVVYHAVDVRDDTAFGSVIDGIYERHGRLDGVVHGAGVIEDRLAREKTSESFERVYDTKVLAALTLAEKLRDDVRFVAFFSSVAGVFGNRGQTDYAAANDFLDKHAAVLNARLEGRVVAISWGPWANGGMVSTELARTYELQGVGLIDPAEGAESFLSELLYGHETDAQVILMRADPDRLL